MSQAATEWAMRQKLSNPAAKLALLVLARHGNDCGECWPSVEVLADVAGYSDRTARSALGWLERSGLIRDTGRRAGRSRRIKVWQLQMRQNSTRDAAKFAAGIK